MNIVFNIHLEFSRSAVLEGIDAIVQENSKGYVFVVDGNVLATAARDPMFRDVVNRASVNICDGSSIALLAGWIHRNRWTAFPGADLLGDCVGANRFRSFFLGGTPEVLASLRKNLSDMDERVGEMTFMDLPFAGLDEFDYQGIADAINRDSPDLIWVSLGAPKQEWFINRLLPHVRRGVLIAIGAAFNFHSGLECQRRAPLWMRRLHLEWLYRSMREPRIARRAVGYLAVLPGIVFAEWRTKRKQECA